MWRMRVGLQPRADRGEQRALLVTGRLGNDRRVALGAHAQVQQQRRIAAVVEDHVGVAAVRPLENAMRVFPVIRERLALPGEHRRAAAGDRRRRVILGGEDVAGRPAHLGAERLQRLDQHRRLDGHVQRAGDARAAQRLRGRELLADRHQAGHLGLGDGDFLATELGQCQVRDLVVAGACGGRFQCGVHTQCS
jgi:hypothetical protein